MKEIDKVKLGEINLEEMDMLRPLSEADAEFLCSIFKDNEEYYNIFFDSESSVSEWEYRVSRFVKQEKIHHFIMQADNNSVGWMSYEEMDAGERGVGILVIKKEYLGCGYGASALLDFLKMCKEDSIHTVYLSVNQDNERAIRFYKKFGFEIYAEEIIPQCNEAINLAQYKMKLDLTV